MCGGSRRRSAVGFKCPNPAVFNRYVGLSALEWTQSYASTANFDERSGERSPSCRKRATRFQAKLQYVDCGKAGSGVESIHLPRALEQVTLRITKMRFEYGVGMHPEGLEGTENLVE